MRRHPIIVLCLLVLMLFAVLGASEASAATCTDSWTSASSGEWDTAGNWSAGVPGSGSHVCIEKAVTVSLTDGSASPIPVASLDIGGEGAAAQLHVSIHDVVESPATTIGASATLTLDGTYHGANGGNASLGGGSVTNRGTIVMQGEGYSATLSGTVLNEGTIEVPFGSVSLGTGSNGGPGSLVNRGTIHVFPASANPAHPAEVGAVSYPITDEAGTIDNEGVFYVSGANGVAGAYTQGNGSETGNPINIGQDSSLAYTGTGASGVEVHTGTPMSGNIAAGQRLQMDIGTTVTEAGSFTNAGAITLNGNYYGGGGGPAGVAVSSGTFTNTGSILAESNDNDPAISGNFTNAGTVTITPNTQIDYSNGLFTNTGTLAPEISSKASSALRLIEGGHLDAGGTLAPTLVEGFVPSVGQEFEIALAKGGSWSGAFGATANGFGADYSHSGYIGAIYGATPPSAIKPPPPGIHAGTLHVTAVKGGSGRVSVTLSCSAGGASCSAASITVTVTEHLKGGRVSAISAKARTKRVTIALGAVTLAAGTTKTKTVALNRTGLALLAKHHPLPAAVSVRSGGATLKSVDVHITPVKKAHRR